jgi:pimeloyl-ACP methyl ester carboxylesterase
MGLSGDLTWWERLVPELGGYFKVVTFDNRGAGLTDKPDERYTISMFAEDTVGLMDVLNIPRAHIFGVSMGGMIAQELVIRYPDRVDQLALGCTHSGGPGFIAPSVEAIQNLTLTRGKSPEEFARQIVSILFSPHFQKRDPEYVKTMIQRYVSNPPSGKAFTNQFWAVLGHNCYDRLPAIDTPTLILTGDADRLIPPKNSKILNERIPGSRIVAIPTAGHAFFIEAPRETARCLLGHFSRDLPVSC